MNKKQKDLLILPLMFLVLVGVYWLSGLYYVRFDMTHEKRFSLSDSTVSMLKTLEEPILITVYLEGDFPAGFKRLRNATEEILDEFKAYAGGNLSYRFMDPFADKTVEEQREMYDYLVNTEGLTPTDLNVKTTDGMRYQSIFPGATVAYKGYSRPVSLLEPQHMQDPQWVLNKSIEKLEYAFATALYQLEKLENRPKIAVAFGHGQLPQALMADFLFSLKDFYRVEGVVLDNNLLTLNQSYKCLIIAKPDSLFRDAEKFVIDQYIMRGGRVLWLIDQVATSLDSLKSSGSAYTVAINKELGLNDMFFKYGFKINYDLIQDAQCGYILIQTGVVNNSPREELMPWFFHPVILNDVGHPLSRNIGPVKLEFASSIDTNVYSPGISKEILLSSSNMSRVLMTPVRVALGMALEEPDEQRFNKQNIPVAIKLDGVFTSAFEGRLAPLAEFPMENQSKPTRMIVVSDGDIVKNKFSAAKKDYLPLGLDPVAGAFYPGNMNFLMNCVNELTDDSWIVPLRSKQFQIRLLDRKALRKSASMWKVINTGLPLLLLMFFGIVWHIIQKKKNTRS
jgi:ABC-2 type transport system permease protein